MVVLTVMIVTSYFLSQIITDEKFFIGNIEINKRNKVAVLLVFLIITFFAGFRYQFVDSGVYRTWYGNLTSDWSIIMQSKDPGFTIFALLLRNISTWPQAILIATSALIYSLVIYTLYHYSVIFELSIYLFLTNGLFLLSINGIRQFIAASIIFSAIRLLFDGKFFKYFLVILIASTFHASALIMIPVYFIARRKAWSIITLFLFLIVAVAYLKFDSLFPIFEEIIEGTQYAGNLNYFKRSGIGANIIRFFVVLLPLVLAFFERNNIKNLWDKSDIIFNLSILNAIIMLFSTYNFIIARLCFYFQIYDILLIPILIKSIKKNILKTTIYLGCIILYYIYLYYEIVYMFGINYRLIF